MRYRVELGARDGRSGLWKLFDSVDAAAAAEAARADWGTAFPVLLGVEEATDSPKIAYRVEVVSADGTRGDRVYKEATTADIATELVVAQFPDLDHVGTFADDPA